jgi:hypothetical protein
MIIAFKIYIYKKDEKKLTENEMASVLYERIFKFLPTIVPWS